MKRWVPIVGLLLLPAEAGCLIPIPLEQQVSTESCKNLMVKSAIPPFGTQWTNKRLETYSFQVDVLTDCTKVAARLYLQLNGTCCDLNLDDPNVTRFDQEAHVQLVDPTAGSYSLVFNQRVLPCATGFPGMPVYVVPVVASGGFVDGAMGVYPEGFGEVDHGHYWTVICP